MWKDWLFFTKNQRIGIIALLSIILLLIIAKWILPLLFPSPKNGSDNFTQEAQQFIDSLKIKENSPNRQDYFSDSYYYPRETYPPYQSYQQQQLPEPVLFVFNPNTLDSAGFVKLGLKPYIASNILKYRAKGGKYKTVADFGKVWGVTPEKLEELKAYIDIPAEAPPPQQATPGYVKKVDDIVLELNSCDTAQLQQIRGIGAGFAKRITGYRKRLGGYVSVNQINEIYGVTPELYSQLAPHFTVNNAAAITKIDVNRASIERLRAHPYLNFYKAKAIYELRRNKGSLKSIDDLKSLPDLDNASLQKIAPYLEFKP